MNLLPLWPTYINSLVGLQLTYATASTISISSGQCYDSTQSNLIANPSALTLSLAVNGLNGLDTGTVAANTAYAVFVISDAANFNPVGCLASLSSTAPFLPAGLFPTNYNKFRRIGWIVTDGSSNILKFYQSEADGYVRYMQYDAPQSVLSTGAATTYTAVNLTRYVPNVTGISNLGRIYLRTAFTPNAAGDTFNLRPTGATGDLITGTGQVAATAINNEIVMLPLVSSGNTSIDYKVSAGTDALSIGVIGYEDIL